MYFTIQFLVPGDLNRYIFWFDVNYSWSYHLFSLPSLDKQNRKGSFMSLIFPYVVYIKLRASLNLLEVIIWNCLHRYKQLFEKKKKKLKVCIACLPNSKQSRLAIQKRCDGDMRRLRSLAQIGGLNLFPKRSF